MAAHRWDLTPAEARALQETLRHRVVLEDDLAADEARTLAGADVGFEAGGAVARGAVAVLGLPGLEPVEHAVARRPTPFPYVPGLLSFREVPVLLAALERLEAPPDVVLCDSQGIAHPRRFGLACHLGVATGLRTVGVAKSRLTGRHPPLPDERGAWVPLEDRGEVIGAVLRSRVGTKPLYVSPGHRVTLATALALTLRALTRYRLPETTRAAHRLASG